MDAENYSVQFDGPVANKSFGYAEEIKRCYKMPALVKLRKFTYHWGT
jgi:hypothetical protein